MDMERTMQFILEMQAKFEANIGLHEERLTRLENAMLKLVDNVGQLRQALLTTNDLVTRLVKVTDEGFKAMDRRFKAVDERLASLAEAGKATDDRLNVLIDVVDKLIRRNGTEGKT